MGNEEKEIILPAVEESRARKIHVFGPYAADGFFGSGNFRKFDGVLAMYHDQGLAPFKTIAGGSGVNFTAGLPFVRTSPEYRERMSGAEGGRCIVAGAGGNSPL